MHPVDEDGRVEHPQPHGEHADAADEEHELPRRRHLHAQPDSGLDHHRHRPERGDRGGHGLHVVGTMPTLGAVGVGDDAAEDAGEDLSRDREAEGEVGIGCGDPTERSEDEQRHCREHEVEAHRARAREPRESHPRLVAARQRGLHRLSVRGCHLDRAGRSCATAARADSSNGSTK